MFLDLVKKRRSIRKYTEDPIPEADIEKILESGILAPTGDNVQGTEFIVVEDKKELEKLSEFKESDGKFIKNAAFAIAIIAKTDSVTYSQDTCVAASYIQLAAEDLGYGSCWANCLGEYNTEGLSAEESLKQILDIPDDYYALGVISIGHKGQKRRKKEILREGRIHRGKFNRK